MESPCDLCRERNFGNCIKVSSQSVTGLSRLQRRLTPPARLKPRQEPASTKWHEPIAPLIYRFPHRDESSYFESLYRTCILYYDSLYHVVLAWEARQMTPSQFPGRSREYVLRAIHDLSANMSYGNLRDRDYLLLFFLGGSCIPCVLRKLKHMYISKEA